MDPATSDRSIAPETIAYFALGRLGDIDEGRKKAIVVTDRSPKSDRETSSCASKIYRICYDALMRALLLPSLFLFSFVACTPQSAAYVWRTVKPKAETGTTLNTSTEKPITRTIRQKVPKTDRLVQRNEQRRKDVLTIANAIFQYSYRGDSRDIPPTIPLLAAGEICRFEAKSCKGLISLKRFLQPYIATLPSDPLAPQGNGTRYFIQKDWRGRYTVSAPDAEEGWLIRVQK